MPQDYTVTLQCSPGDWSLEFTDPDGNHISIDDYESIADFIIQAVEFARAALASTEPTKEAR